MRNMQSQRSRTPPWPGMREPKFFLLQALLKPLQKNPATGPTVLAKRLMAAQWMMKRLECGRTSGSQLVTERLIVGQVR